MQYGFDLTTLYTTRCSKKFILWACYPGQGSSTWTLAAWGDRSKVLMDMGTQYNPNSNIENEVAFYYSTSWSWCVAYALAAAGAEQKPSIHRVSTTRWWLSS